VKLVHQNNFEVIRLTLASLVVVLHCYDLTGAHYADYLSDWTGGQITLPYIIIRGFVIMSGYLVLKSLQRSTSIKQYLWRRFLRIYPPLIVALVLCALVAGPFLTTLSISAYYRHPDTWLYMVYSLRIFMVKHTECLPGVFTNNPVLCAVNGSLWTIWVEEVLYIALIALFFIRRKPGLMRIAICVTWLAMVVLHQLAISRWQDVEIPFSRSVQWDYFADLLVYFFSGCLMTLVTWKDMRRNRIILSVAIIVAAPACYFHIYQPLGYLLYPAAMVAFGSDCVPILLKPFKWGNPSYGLYIYSYPIQQALIQSIAPTASTLLLISVPLSFAFGYASWYLIETPFLRLKERVH
jgi:peptidoglycan/LPS O-acetylase OafA/YrhL